MRRAAALLTVFALLAAAPGAALAATTATKSGGKSGGGSSSGGAAATSGGSGSGGVSPQTSSATPTATQPAVPITPNGSTNPLSGGVSPVSPTPTPTASTPTQVITNATSQTAGGSTLSSASALAIVVGAVVVLGGISFFIWRDARRRAPVRTTDAGAGDAGRRTGSKAPPKPRKLSTAERKRRKRGKAR
jgi:hypothetical protein